MSHRWIAWAEKLSNLLRRKWQALSVHTRVHAKWCLDMPKPPRGIRTRWLNCPAIFTWLLPKIKMMRFIIRVYFLKDNRGKFSKAFQQVSPLLS